MTVVPRDNRVRLPKDFVVVKGFAGAGAGTWLRHIGDHLVVWARGNQEIKPGERGS